MPLAKAGLIDSVYNHLDLFKRRSGAIVESLLDISEKTLEVGEKVLITG